MPSVAAYIRDSTDEQTNEHQFTAVEEWGEANGIDIADIDIYAETASGASTNRDQFEDLLEEIEADSYEKVVVWEISRIARKGTQAQRFFDSCEEAQTTIHVTNGSIRTIEPDGHGRLIADIIAAVAAEERRSLIRRTKAGIQRAKEQGKYVGQPPAGFVVDDDGNLRPNLQPDYDDGETGYLDIQDALEEIDDGQSYRAAAGSTPNVTRQTLSNIDNDDGRRKMYFEQGETV